jgi:cytochrome c oxidase assembly protein subunit 15
MVGGVFFEHSHRLLGALVGLLTLALAGALWTRGGRLRWLGLVAVAAVIAQGVVGGLRVVLQTDALAMVHGPLAQAFFAFIVALALVTSARMARPASPLDAATRGLALAAAALVYVQIVFGALLTHAGRIDLHLGGALAVFTLLPIVTTRLRRGGDVVAAPAARALLILLALQLLLGIGAYVVRFSAVWIPGGQLTMLVVPVAHRLTGGLILAAAVVLAVRALAAPRAAEPALTAPAALGATR